MRPIKLKMAAFGAYVEPVTIDFENELRGEKIFLIHGATGAGKTTILDAITYALYGETSGKAREVKDMRSKGVDDNLSTKVDFNFALGDKIFEVQREISYYPRRKSNKYETRAALFCDGDLIETKDRAVKNKITELLGFDAEQFRQVVLLPQGEFKKFLSADADDRQGVLNVLFDSEPYKKIEDAISERAKNSSTELKELETRRDTLKKQLDDSESNSLPELEEKFSAAQIKVAELKKFFDDAQLKLTDGKLLSAKFADLKKATSDLDAAKIRLDEADKKFLAAQSEYQRREAEETLRKELEAKVHELKELKPALDDLNKKNSALDGDDGERQKLRKATEIFTDCDKKAKRYDERLAELEAEKATLADADVQFEKAKTTFDKAEELDVLLKEISQLKRVLAMEQEKFSVVEEKLKAAQIELTRLQIVNSAAYLATRLEDGKPCPVCGSLEHPAVIAEAIPTATEIQAAQKKVDRLTKDHSQQIGIVKTTTGKLSSAEKRLKDYDGVPDVTTAKKIRDEAEKKAAALAKCRQNIDKGNRFIKENRAALDAANKNKNDAQNSVAKLEWEITELKKKIPEKYLADNGQLDADLTSKQREFDELDAAWKSADKSFRESGKEKSAREATLKSIQKTFDALQIGLKDKTPPDIDSLEKKAAEIGEKYGAARDEKAKLETNLNTLKKFSSELEEVEKILADKQKIADMWRRLSDVANASGKGESELKISFQRYFLSTMFNEVVTEANNRLKKMSNGRYLFQMKDAGKRSNSTAGLNLEIFDEHNGEFRPVETLSGGESFLASLSLALGLAAVVRNKVGGIKLDTIFIDEGFGSLDSEALDDAISTIIEQSGGRLVGIISHVEELKNQIPVRLEVKSTETGSEAKFER